MHSWMTGSRLPKMTRRTVWSASRRSGGSESRYAATVVALLFMAGSVRRGRACLVGLERAGYAARGGGSARRACAALVHPEVEVAPEPPPHTPPTTSAPTTGVLGCGRSCWRAAALLG